MASEPIPRIERLAEMLKRYNALADQYMQEGNLDAAERMKIAGSRTVHAMAEEMRHGG